MKHRLAFLTSLSFSALTLSAADLKPAATTEIPVSAKRDVVIKLSPSSISHLPSPKSDLPDGYELQVVAASPLVTHPIMGCLDDRGRLFVGDATGVNWNKKQLEANPPNRIIMLEDTDGDGIYDKSTVFADKMTFPQGGCWLNGSLYVCSPPSLWKLTDTDGDGVADKREELVTGFEYTGNAADVHGPWLHPNGRLYWCHGRKGHKVFQKPNQKPETKNQEPPALVHEGLASGIWSCKPDGTDVQWHSLGCGDNPVKVDFTPEGEIIGVQNLYYSNPRGDTIVHWLYGGVYERADQMKAIEGLPRTLEHMPVMYNFGHVAVSGCCFWNNYQSADTPVRHQIKSSGAAANSNEADKSVRAPLQFMVTHFNTQRVVRMELTPDGATYKATENEFLRLHDPDVHFTDVIEDKDGSLIVLDTGGWFRIGCPSSLMAKPDVMGAVYRIKSNKAANRLASKPAKSSSPDLKFQIANLKSSDPRVRGLALQQFNELVKVGGFYEGHDALNLALRDLMKLKLDAASEHALIALCHKLDTIEYDALTTTSDPTTIRHLLLCVSFGCSGDVFNTIKIVRNHLDSADSDLAQAVLNFVIAHERSDDLVTGTLLSWLSDEKLTSRRFEAIAVYGAALIAQPETQKLIATMLSHKSAAVRGVALNIIANQKGNETNETWLAAIEKLLSGLLDSQVIDAIKKLKTNRFDDKLQSIANDTKQPLSLRLRALSAVKGLKLTPDTFAVLQSVLTSADSSAAARIQAATMLASAPLHPEQITTLAPVLASVGPIELKALLALISKCKDMDVVRHVATELAKNPVIASQQESAYRSAFADKPTDIFETIILPAYRKATEASDAKKRQLGPLAEKVIAQGDASSGRAIYESGKGTCIACHQIGDKGRNIGPNLSKIGAIRTERDILESVIFPSNTLSRDYEAHIIETSDGQSMMGVIKSHTAEGLLVVDVAGLEKNIPHTQIVNDTQLTTSLMPMGLDQTLQEKELCDLVAYLRSLK